MAYCRCYFSAGSHFCSKNKDIIHNWVQNISRNQLAGKQWCHPKCSLCHHMTETETKFRSYWTSFQNTIQNWEMKDTNTSGSFLNVTPKNVGAFLAFVETSLCTCEEGWHRVSLTAGPGLLVLSLMHWSPHLLHWGLVNLTSLWRIHHLSACSGKSHNKEKNYQQKWYRWVYYVSLDTYCQVLNSLWESSDLSNSSLRVLHLWK